MNRQSSYFPFHLSDSEQKENMDSFEVFLGRSNPLEVPCASSYCVVPNRNLSAPLSAVKLQNGSLTHIVLLLWELTVDERHGSKVSVLTKTAQVLIPDICQRPVKKTETQRTQGIGSIT